MHGMFTDLALAIVEQGHIETALRQGTLVNIDPALSPAAFEKYYAKLPPEQRAQHAPAGSPPWAGERGRGGTDRRPAGRYPRHRADGGAGRALRPRSAGRLPRRARRRPAAEPGGAGGGGTGGGGAADRDAGGRPGAGGGADPPCRRLERAGEEPFRRAGGSGLPVPVQRRRPATAPRGVAGDGGLRRARSSI